MGGSSFGKGSSAPAAPDFNAAAQQQAQSSQNAVNQQTAANRPNQTNAFGASTVWGSGPNGQPTQTTSFGGPLAAGVGSLESQIGSQGALGTGDQARNQAINATYGQMTSRLDPQWAQRDEQTRAQLAAQGLDPGSQAYDTAMGNLGRERNDAYTSALNNSIANANQAQALTFGQNLQSQMAPYQQLGALQGLSGQAGFSQAGQAQPTQYLPAAMAGYQGALQGYGIDQQGKNSAMGGLSSLGGTAAMAGAMSDERLKDNIERLPDEAIPGVHWARWKWKTGGDGFGVIAQDLERVRPDLVTMRDGFRVVDYGGLLAGR